MTSEMAGIHLFMTSTDLGYHRFIVANKKFIDVYVRAPTKFNAPGSHIGIFGSKLKKCLAKSSLLLCFLR